MIHLRPVFAAGMALLAFNAADALSQVVTTAECVGDTARIRVDIVGWDLPEQYTGFVLVREALGLCDSRLVLTTPAIPIDHTPPPEGSAAEHIFMERIPVPERWFRYGVMLADAGGALTPAWNCGTNAGPFAYVAQGEALLTRGFLVWFPPHDIRFSTCAQDCWLWCDQIDLSQVEPTAYQPYVSPISPGPVPVDVYGYPEQSGMLWQYCMYATRIVPAPSGVCGPLPAAHSSWGRLKASYR